MLTPNTLKLTVDAVRQPHPLVRLITLRSADGSRLPAFDAGAHLRLQVQLPNGRADWRHYSLIRLDPLERSDNLPTHYNIGVRLESAGRGGSQFMHRLKLGDVLVSEPPRNDFPLLPHEGTVILVAGGIGVTPLSSMATQCVAAGSAVRMVYAGRERAQMVLSDELGALLGERLRLHTDVEDGGPLDIGALLDGCGPRDVLYVCGPQGLLDAILAAARQRAWTEGRVHFELFSAPATQAGDQAFDLVLHRSGQTLRVAAGQSILECLEQHGCDPLSDCRRGECGVCAVDVIEGDIDHRDYVLTQAEKASGKVIQVCVSRAHSARLVLDL